VVEENKRRVGARHNPNNLVEFALPDEGGGIGTLAALDEGGGNRGTRRSGELFKLSAAGIEIEGWGSISREVFFSSHDGSRGAGKPSGCGELLVLAEFLGEFDYDKHCEFLLRLRGTEFAGKECRVLGLPCFDETPTDFVSGTPAWWGWFW
jgi:hypothetical protein